MRLTLAVSKKVPMGCAPAASFCLSVFSMRNPPYLVSMPRLYLHFGGMASIVEKEGCNFASLFFMLESHITSQYFVQQIVVLFQIVYTRQVEFLALFLLVWNNQCFHCISES